jgi:hypothetical protein
MSTSDQAGRKWSRGMVSGLSTNECHDLKLEKRNNASGLAYFQNKDYKGLPWTMSYCARLGQTAASGLRGSSGIRVPARPAVPNEFWQQCLVTEVSK